MGMIVGWVTKTILTEKMMKSGLIMLGDYLVASSKNKLDDKIWDKVKKTL